MKHIRTQLLALLAAAALLCPAAQAANDSPALWMDGGSGGAVQLTLERLGAQEVNSIQLTVTLSGRYPGAGFTPNPGSSGQYSQCRVEEAANQTSITIYLDSLTPLNQNGTVALGTLDLGRACTAPSSAQLTLLDRALTSSGSSQSIPVRSTLVSPPPDTKPGSSGGSSSGSSGSSSGGSSSGSSGSSSGGSSGSSSGGSSGTGSDAVQPKPLHFTDVKQGVWFYDAVRYVYENKLMSGISDTQFGPDLPTSRGMIVTILYRLAGSPSAGSPDFTDVAPDAYYASAVAWAAGQGIVSGYGGGRFGPNDPITREQAAVILRGYARFSGAEVSAQADLSGFADAGTISSYAVESMRWANALGLINGTSSSTLTPGGTTTRAQAAVILRGFCEQVIGG